MKHLNSRQIGFENQIAKIRPEHTTKSEAEMQKSRI